MNFKMLTLSSMFLLVSCTTITQKEANTNPSIDHLKQKEVIPFIGNFSVNRFTLANGLRLLVVEDHSSPTLAYQTWFKVGSRDEVPGRTGLAHLFEHMMFKGTKNMKDGEFDRALEGAGAQGENAFTSRDYTAYIQEMPKDKLELIAKLEADRMVNLVINPASFKTEREVVQNERRFRTENSPDGLIYQELFGLAFQKHPYHWPVIGYQKDLENMSHKNALDFYQAYYSPNHATVVVVGDVKADEVLKTIQSHYGKLEPQETPEHSISSETAQKSPRKKELKLNIQVDKLMIGYHVPGLTHQDIPKLAVFQSILTGGKSSRLNQALVETGIATSVDAYDPDDKDPTLMIIAANLQKGKKVYEAESAILRELSKLTQETVSQAELDRAKNKINFGFYEGLESNYQKAHFLGHYEATAGDLAEGIRQQKKILDVSAANIQDIAKRYFNPNHRTVITGVKK